jgi:acetyl-CoA carboxylase biotin carboxyl carrier protein
MGDGPGHPRNSNQFKQVRAMKTSQIKELIELMEEGQLAEIEISGLWQKIRLSKYVGTPPPAQTFVPQGKGIPAETPAPADKSVETVQEPDGDNLVPIEAPVVGTFYAAPAPDADPFVEVGTVVEPGQTVCIVEAMKIMNEIEAETRGRVARILVKNAQPVEYGQKLFLLEPL